MSKHTLENARLLEMLQSDDPSRHKEAAEGTSEYLHLRAHENGIARAVMEPETITPSEFTQQVDTDKPCVVRNMEPSSAGAVNLSLGIGPNDAYIGAPKYRVMFDRIASKRYTADVAQLSTYTYSLKELFNELILKDMLYREDVNMFSSVESGLGSRNATDADDIHLKQTGARGWITVGSYSRQAMALARNGIGETDNALPVETCVINHSFVSNILGMDHDALGGPGAEDLFKNGWTKMPLMGMQAIVTIKRDLVPNDSIFMFAPQDYIGDFLIVTDATMSFKKEDYMLKFFGYEYLGQCWKNIAAFARADFTGTAEDWRPDLES